MRDIGVPPIDISAALNLGYSLKCDRRGVRPKGGYAGNPRVLVALSAGTGGAGAHKSSGALSSPSPSANPVGMG